MTLNHIPYQEELINKEIIEELARFNSATTPVEENMIFFTEDTDHEEYPDLMLQPRKGIDSIERKRWGFDQRKHGKVTRLRGTGTKYQIPERKNVEYDENEYRLDLHEILPEKLGLEGYPVESDPVVETELWDGTPIYGIFTSRFNIIGDYTNETKLDLEAVQYAMRGMTPDQKLEFVLSNKEYIKQQITFK